MMTESLDTVVTTLRIIPWGRYQKKKFQAEISGPKVDDKEVVNDATVYMIFHDHETLGVKINTLFGILSYVHNAPSKIQIEHAGLHKYGQNVLEKYVEEHNKKIYAKDKQ